MKILKIGIVGAGRMGRIRAQSGDRHPRCEVVAIADTHLAQAQALAAEIDCTATGSWSELIKRNDIDAIVVATPHKYLAEISAAALAAGKHVLCEKPGGRTSAEVESVLRVLYGTWPPPAALTLSSAGKCVSSQMVMGFTLRHHPAISRARMLVARGDIGKPMYIIGRYGHGGRPGYEQEWRGNRDLSGGGELLDQGVHLIDLSRWFLGEFEEVSGYVGTYFWRPSAPEKHDSVEDNAFLLLRSTGGQVASLQASWTQWKNLFVFEIYGESGFLQVRGLGGGYGEEKLVVGRRNPSGGTPEMKEIPLPCDESEDHKGVWAREWQAFVNTVLDAGFSEENAPVVQPASAIDAWQALRIVEAAYEASRAAATPLRREPSNAPLISPQKAMAAAAHLKEKNDPV